MKPAPFVAGQHHLNRRAAQRLQEIEIFLARQRKEPVHAFVRQRGDKEVGRLSRFGRLPCLVLDIAEHRSFPRQVEIATAGVRTDACRSTTWRSAGPVGQG